MKAIKNNMGSLLIILVLAFLFFSYKTFFKPGEESTTAPQDAGTDVLSLNSALDTVTLDQSIFSSNAYRNLVDFSAPIPPQPTGRHNPFDILGAQ